MKKELNSYDERIGIGEFDDFTYCEKDKMWYEDAKEVLPLPRGHSERQGKLSSEIKINHYAYQNDYEYTYIEAEELENFEGYARYILGENNYFDTLSSVILLNSDFQELILCTDEYTIWALDDFITKLKNNSYATQYLENYCAAKFIAWTNEKNRTRFVVHSYNEYYKQFETIFDIMINRDSLVESLEKIITTWKETLYTEIEKQAKILGKEIKNYSKSNAINHFFPELKLENKKTV